MSATESEVEQYFNKLNAKQLKELYNLYKTDSQPALTSKHGKNEIQELIRANFSQYLNAQMLQRHFALKTPKAPKAKADVVAPEVAAEKPKRAARKPKAAEVADAPVESPKPVVSKPRAPRKPKAVAVEAATELIFNDVNAED